MVGVTGNEKRAAEIHMFEYRGKRLVYDVNSGSLHEVDEPAWEFIHLLHAGLPAERITAMLSQRYPHSNVVEVQREIETLREEKLLFSSPPAAVEQGPSGGRLKSLCLFISRSCNLQCRYCFARSPGKENNGHMSRDVALKAVDLLLEQEGGRYCEIDFFGGEPLLNFPLVQEIVGYARTAGRRRGKEFTFTLTTNALLLGEEVAAFLNKENLNVILSLDGRPAVHDRMRRTVLDTGSYDRVLPLIRNFLAGRGYNNYYIRGTYTAYNLDFCRDVEHLLEEGFHSLSLEPVVAAGEADYALHRNDLRPLEQEYDRLVELFLQRREAGRPFHFYHFGVDLEKGPCLYKRLSGCGAGREYLAVAADGSLYPCHQFVGTEAFCLGRLGDGPFELDLQRGDQVARSAAQREACPSCWARYLCGRGCAAVSHFLAGDLCRNDALYCALQQIRLERALYLQAV
ncbi:MAG: thioether cross-link-forming SCIFF peptide maturase [Bacillota bacterium]